MSVSMWSYRPEVCDGGGCPGDCDLCDKPKNMEDEDDTTDCIKREDAIWAIINATTDKTIDGTRRLTDCVTTIKNIPSADVVEVVRCKDCKYWYRYIRYCDHNICDFWSTDSSLITKHDDYCSYGERAEA